MDLPIYHAAIRFPMRPSDARTGVAPLRLYAGRECPPTVSSKGRYGINWERHPVALWAMIRSPAFTAVAVMILSSGWARRPRSSRSCRRCCCGHSPYSDPQRLVAFSRARFRKTLAGHCRPSRSPKSKRGMLRPRPRINWKFCLHPTYRHHGPRVSLRLSAGAVDPEVPLSKLGTPMALSRNFSGEGSSRPSICRHHQPHDLDCRVPQRPCRRRPNDVGSMARCIPSWSLPANFQFPRGDASDLTDDVGLLISSRKLAKAWGKNRRMVCDRTPREPAPASNRHKRR